MLAVDDAQRRAPPGRLHGVEPGAAVVEDLAVTAVDQRHGSINARSVSGGGSLGRAPGILLTRPEGSQSSTSQSSGFRCRSAMINMPSGDGSRHESVVGLAYDDRK